MLWYVVDFLYKTDIIGPFLSKEEASDYGKRFDHNLWFLQKASAPDANNQLTLTVKTPN